MDTLTVSLGVTHHTARLNGITQHWVTAGGGPPVYLLHGFPETWFAWRKQIPVLAERYTIIAPDLRGYGETEKPHSGYDKRTMANDLAALMDHHGHKRAPIIGHDRGARVGTRFAKDHRDRIDRFAALDNVPTRILVENSTPGLNHTPSSVMTEVQGWERVSPRTIGTGSIASPRWITSPPESW